MEIYKLRNSDGLYWKGNTICNHLGHEINNSFDKIGKYWINKTVLLSDLEKVEYMYLYLTKLIPKSKTLILPSYLSDCKIIKFDLIESEECSINTLYY